MMRLELLRPLLQYHHGQRARQTETLAAKVHGQDVSDTGDAGLRLPGLLGRDQNARRG